MQQLTHAACRLDIFAINQHDPGSELHNGGALARTIELAAETLVVLDPHTPAFPLQRLWCLYEMGSCPAAKLMLLTPGFSEKTLFSVFSSINVETAACFNKDSEKMIKEHIVKNNASLLEFEKLLKLRLLLKPTSCALSPARTPLALLTPSGSDELDCKALLANSQDEQWAFEQLRAFACCEEGVPRLVCIAGGAGEGKSTIAAAIYQDAKPTVVHAAHFFKASDKRRQDVCVVVRSLAYQLCLAFPAFSAHVLALSEDDIGFLSNPVKAWELLLKAPLSAMPRGTRVVLLFDALDEANLTESGAAGTCISKALFLLLELGRLHESKGYNGAALSVVVTSRPELPIVSALRGRWKEGYKEFTPDSLRCGGAGEAKLHSLLRLKAGLTGSVDECYLQLFESAPLDSETSALLAVLLSAREPPSLALLEALRVRNACAALPGWGWLFYERDHCVHLLHRSLAEWLRS